MIDRVTLLVLTGMVLAACVKQDDPDFCENHTLFHAQHADASAELTVTIAEDGGVSAELSVPDIRIAATSTNLSDAANVFALESERPCSIGSGDLTTGQGRLNASYAAQCGADNKLGQINVLLFDAMPGLDEVLVHVTTPVTEKHFAIHRQCASAIFRLE